MRILMLSDHYPPFSEGAYELFCERTAVFLRELGHEVTVLTTHLGVQHPEKAGGVYRLLHSATWQLRHGLASRLAQVEQAMMGQRNYTLTRHVLRQLQPDFAFVWQMSTTSILPVIAVRDLNVPIVFNVGSHWLCRVRQAYVGEQSRLKRWYRSALIGFRRLDALQIGDAIFNSQSLMSAYRTAGFDVQRAVVIPRGIEDRWIADSPPTRDDTHPFRLVCAGRLEEAKGTEIALQTLAHLVNTRGLTNITLDFIGRGQDAYIESLHRFAANYGLGDYVRFIGFVPREELVQRYRDYDALLFPTLQWEGLPVAILEAMSQGLPVVASCIGGPKDIVIEGTTGLLVPSGKPIAFAQAIERLACDRTLARRLGARSLEVVREKYRLSDMLNAYDAYLTPLFDRMHRTRHEAA